MASPTGPDPLPQRPSPPAEQDDGVTADRSDQGDALTGVKASSSAGTSSWTGVRGSMATRPR